MLFCCNAAANTAFYTGPTEGTTVQMLATSVASTTAGHHSACTPTGTGAPAAGECVCVCVAFYYYWKRISIMGLCLSFCEKPGKWCDDILCPQVPRIRHRFLAQVRSLEGVTGSLRPLEQWIPALISATRHMSGRLASHQIQHSTSWTCVASWYNLEILPK